MAVQLERISAPIAALQSRSCLISSVLLETLTRKGQRRGD
jgi:hypothetical protein